MSHLYSSRRDPLDLMRVPCEGFGDSLHHSHNNRTMQSTMMDSTMHSSHGQMDSTHRSGMRTRTNGIVDGTLMNGTQMHGTAMNGRMYNSSQRSPATAQYSSQQEQSWAKLKRSVGIPDGQRDRAFRELHSLQYATVKERPYAVPKGGVRMDPSTGQVASGVNVGEIPLPGKEMSGDECATYGLPPGSKWVDNEAVKNPVSPLFDPKIQKVDWNELAVARICVDQAQGDRSFQHMLPHTLPRTLGRGILFVARGGEGFRSCRAPTRRGPLTCEFCFGGFDLTFGVVS